MATYAHVIRQLRTQIEINRDKHWVHLLVVAGGGFFFSSGSDQKIDKKSQMCREGGWVTILGIFLKIPFLILVLDKGGPVKKSPSM